MRILLINPSFNRYGGIKGHGGSMVPLNLCYLAAYAREAHRDSEFRILDAEIKGLSHEEAAKESAEFMPDVIGVTSTTCAFDSAIGLTGKLKEKMPQVPVIIGGAHPSALPERTLNECGADFAAIGEGEETFSEFLVELKNGTGDWKKINGLAYREGGAIKVNPPRALIKELDRLPFPARDLVDNSLYSPPPTKRVSAGANTLISTSRGCTFDCGFCGAQTVWGRRIRSRSPESVIAEIEECVAKYGISSFNFSDEFFTAHKKRVSRICALILEKGLKISWVCSARAQDLDREMLSTMRLAGCGEISFGIESGNSEILKSIDKSLDLEEAVQAVRLTEEAGIKTHASYIIGYLNETEETIKDTMRFSKRLNTDIAAFFIASPLPGTRLYHEAHRKGYIREDARWIDYSPLSNNEPVLRLPGLPSASLKAWHRKALRGYYLRPGYILKRLSKLKGLYEIGNLVEGLKLFARIKN